MAAWAEILTYMLIAGGVSLAIIALRKVTKSKKKSGRGRSFSYFTVSSSNKLAPFVWMTS